jgi:hypothetical protein
MRTFLRETLEYLYQEHETLSSLTLILPSKRAGGFLKNELKLMANKTQFVPKILSIEEFIEQVSGLEIIDTTELLFKSYIAYQNTPGITEKDSFDTYATWAQTLLNDFNEIDRYLVDPKDFFAYLDSIKTLERWNLKEEPTVMVQNYLSFWSHLPTVYNNLYQLLKKESVGYQGMVYREAANAIDIYSQEHQSSKFIFIGFNALNNAEQKIITTLLEANIADVHWDADSYFLNDNKHGASLFLRRYFKNWPYYANRAPKGISSHFETGKNIHLVATQKNVGQAKYVGQLLAGFSEEKLSNTAIVLADEQLLVPILHSLPPNVKSVNVTMGMSLREFPISGFFELLFHLQTQGGTPYYYKDVLTLLQHSFGKRLLPQAEEIIRKMQLGNRSHIAYEELNTQTPNEHHLIKWIFEPWQRSEQAICCCLNILEHCQDRFQEQPLQRAVLHKLFQVFTKLQTLNAQFDHFSSVKSAQAVFVEAVATTTLDFEGDAYRGLQIMGVLETRVLDFENIIVLSVNEGILPTGKSNTSFITYDLKKQFKLPLYTEKDAIYTYHFYHMLQRAKDITLLYTTQAEGLSAGEKSRFLLQLEIDRPAAHSLTHSVVSPTIPISSVVPEEIAKTPSIQQRIRELAEYGFSPSALTGYIRNPIDFYFEKIVQVKEAEMVEETVAANTLGTIVHDTLETFYGNHINERLSLKSLQAMKPQIEGEVTRQFEKTYRQGTFHKGKNLIIFEVAKRYVSNFIDFEIAEIEKGNTIEILSVENKLEAPLHLPELDFPIKIRGTVDRVDRYNGKLRIVDYKTGSVKSGDVQLSDWDVLTQDYKYSKAFQVLTYAWIRYQNRPFEEAQAGIISFKNLKQGFLPFGLKTGYRERDTVITPETIQQFETELLKLICEIANASVPFTEKEISK